MTERLVEGYFKKYKPYMQAFERSLVSKATPISEHHLVQLGKMLENFDLMKKLHEEAGTLNTLGELPKVAHAVITATMSNAILPVIASTQAIEAQKSLVYFKNVRAETTKGNIVAGDNLVNPLTGIKYPSGYASGNIVGAVGATGDGTAKTFAFVLPAPIRREFTKIKLEGFVSTVFGQDVGPKGTDLEVGTIMGHGMFGTVNYVTGAVALTFNVAPPNGAKVFVDYQQNLEAMNDLPKISSFLDTTIIEAQPYALKAVTGLFEQYALRKQLGDSVLEDMSLELTRQINAEIGGDLIRQYSANAVGTTNFSLTALAGVSEKLHRESYAFRKADAEAEMIKNAGRGTIKTMIVGREHAALVQGLDGFQLLSDGNSLGAHIFGIYKGVTYVRVPDDSLLAPKAGIGLYVGASPLESAGVFCPFMPLTTVEAPMVGENPLRGQKVVACMAGVKCLVPQYATKFNLTA